MKKLLTFLFSLIMMAGYSQSPTKGALNTIDTTWKPTIKMLAINKLDNTVVYWNQSYWSVVASGSSGGAVLAADLPLDITADVISIPAASGVNDGYLSSIKYTQFDNKWGPAGNAACSGDFFGTTNTNPFLVKANNLQVASISGDGNYRYNFSPNALSQTGTYNFIFGYQPTISSNYSLSGGYQTSASGVASVSINRNTQASGNYSFACGSSSIASGQVAFAANNAQMATFFGTGFGQYNEISTDASLPTSIGANNRIFIIGNGSATSNRHNALTVLHGSDVVNGTKPLFGFNTLLPTSTVSVGGSFEATYVAKTADYTANELDYTIHFTANTSTFTLPTAVGCTGRIYVVKNTSGNNLTLATTSAQTIDGSAPGTLATGSAAQFQSTGANWIKIN